MKSPLPSRESFRPKPKLTSHNINVRIGSDVFDRLQHASRKTGVPASVLAREGIRLVIGKIEANGHLIIGVEPND